MTNYNEAVSRQVAALTPQKTRPDKRPQRRDATGYALLPHLYDPFIGVAAGAFEREEDAALVSLQAQKEIESLVSEFDEDPPQAGKMNHLSGDARA